MGHEDTDDLQEEGGLMAHHSPGGALGDGGNEGRKVGINPSGTYSGDGVAVQTGEGGTEKRV
eukprot:6194032-Pleurochrysis_carterae.AAC.1